MIKAVIFDCMGVLTKDHDIAEMISNHAEPEMKKKVFNFAIGLWNGAKRKKGMASKYYWEILSEFTPLSSEELFNTIHKQIEINQESVVWLKELSKKYKIGILSNQIDGWLQRILDENNITAYCHVIRGSFDSFYAKPQMEAFKDILLELDCNPEDAVFIDDLEKNVSAAKDLGLNSIQFSDVQNAKKEFKKLFG